MKMEPERGVEIKEEANGDETDDELYIDDLIKEEETDTDDNVISEITEENPEGKKDAIDFGMGYGHFLATEYSKQDAYLGYSREDLINDDLLKDLPVRALNQRLKWLTKEDIAALKLKRRTLKNRDYARTSRQKRVTKIQELEITNRTLREELARLRRELSFAVAERDYLRAKYEPGSVGSWCQRRLGKEKDLHEAGQQKEKAPPTVVESVSKERPVNIENAEKEKSVNKAGMEKEESTRNKKGFQDGRLVSEVGADKGQPVNKTRVEECGPVNEDNLEKCQAVNKNRTEEGQLTDKDNAEEVEPVKEDNTRNNGSIEKGQPINRDSVEKELPDNENSMDKKQPANSVEKELPINKQSDKGHSIINNDSAQDSESVDIDTGLKSQPMSKVSVEQVQAMKKNVQTMLSVSKKIDRKAKATNNRSPVKKERSVNRARVNEESVVCESEGKRKQKPKESDRRVERLSPSKVKKLKETVSVEPEDPGVSWVSRPLKSSLGTVEQEGQSDGKEDQGGDASPSGSLAEDLNAPTLEEECLDVEEDVTEMEDPLKIPVGEPEVTTSEPIEAYCKVREFELKLRKSDGAGKKNSSLILDALMGSNGVDPKSVPSLERFEKLFQEKDLEKRNSPPALPSGTHGRVKKTPVKRRLKNKIEVINVTEKNFLCKRIKKNPLESVEEFVPPPEDIFSQSVPIRSQLDLLLDKPP